MNTLDERILEKLVDGELGAAERAAVLRELDDVPDGWRRLGLAFLADQVLRETFLEARRSTATEPVIRPVVAPLPSKVKPPRRSGLQRWSLGVAACAASALIAFGLGLWSAGGSQPFVPHHPTHAAAPQPPAPPVDAETLQVAATPMPTLTQSARLELERRGFVVQERPRVLSVRRPDGRVVEVIVNEVELLFVGRQSIL